MTTPGEQSPLLIPLVFKGQQVRTLIDERDQSFWAHAGDVCALLGIANTSDAVSRIKSIHKRNIGISDVTGRMREQVFIGEQAIYRLAFRSNKPEAEEFT